MKVIFHTNFEKKYKKHSAKLKRKVKERLDLFFNDPYDPVLGNHALRGTYSGYRSINVTGDIRIIYKLLDKNTVLFVDIDSHSNLYR